MEYAGFDPSTTTVGLGRILEAVTGLCPRLAGLEVRRSWAGLRPMTPDGIPILGPEPRLRGLWYAAGHGRNGVLLAAITAVVLQRMMSGQQPTENLNPLRPERFWAW
jgi:glycine/D-amino acid oxidase-like deaminating enzyme